MKELEEKRRGLTRETPDWVWSCLSSGYVFTTGEGLPLMVGEPVWIAETIKRWRKQK